MSGFYIVQLLKLHLVSDCGLVAPCGMPLKPEVLVVLAAAEDFATGLTTAGLDGLDQADDAVAEQKIFVPREIREAMGAVRADVSAIRDSLAMLSDLISAANAG
jgi:hypothetical protein